MLAANTDILFIPLLLVIAIALLACAFLGLRHYTKQYLLGALIGAIAFGSIWLVVGLTVVASDSGEGQYIFPKKQRQDGGSVTVEKHVGSPTFMENIQGQHGDLLFSKLWRLALAGGLFGGAIATMFARTSYYTNELRKIELAEDAEVKKNNKKSDSSKKSKKSKASS